MYILNRPQMSRVIDKQTAEHYLPCGHIVQTINFSKNCNSNYTYSIYPNPTDSELTISSEDQIYKTEAATENINTQKFKAELINSFGEKIRVGDNLGSNNIVLDTQNIPSGTYFLHITYETGDKKTNCYTRQ